MMIPLWLKVGYTLFLCVIVPAYWRRADAGPLNFLWFSDIALLGTGATLWLESSLIASTMAVGVLLPELFWNAGFFGRLLTGKRLGSLTDYMFDARASRFMRGLSLFHVILPLAAYAVLAASAFAILVETREALFGVGAAVLLLLFIGIHNAWDAIVYHVFVKRADPNAEPRREASGEGGS